MRGISIEARGLAFSYPDGNRAIADLSFSIAAGQCVGLVGANGAGKSTLLMLLSGILRADRGEILIGGIPLDKTTQKKARSKLGYVFQDSDDQLFMTTVAEDVAFGPRNMGLSEAEVSERCRCALAAVGIPHLADRPPFRLSGGEKRAAAIAAVLSMGPEVLVLDEPTSSLDPRSRRKLMDTLASLSQTKLIASHDLDFIYESCSRVLVLAEGRLRAEGPTEEILGDADLMDGAGLEPPLAMRNCPRCGAAKPLGVPYDHR
jgi:cobalt/nickel transport system ATP-binding protein